ncbi:unnamed protein product [Lathyrus oleraceus]
MQGSLVLLKLEGLLVSWKFKWMVDLARCTSFTTYRDGDAIESPGLVLWWKDKLVSIKVCIMLTHFHS